MSAATSDRHHLDVEVRALTPDDTDALRRFFGRVPEGDRTFFREDVLLPGVVERWLADPGQHRLVALVDGEIAGSVAVIPGVGWTRHVGELRLVVDPAFRRRGVGRLLAQRAVIQAVELGTAKLVVEVVAEQDATVAMFTALGFEPEGLLKDHVRSHAGEMHDLLVLSHVVQELWDTMRATGIDELVLADSAADPSDGA
ncbi:MAG: GNAT family N-acetyltransferase [Ilumatobacteraceae bacterium]